MRLFIFRHGETDANFEGVLQGHSDNELNYKGETQAEELSKKLSAEGLDVILTSPMQRAVKTAEIVARPNKSEVIVLQDLHEIVLGCFDGVPKKELFSKYKTIFNDKTDVTNPEFMDYNPDFSDNKIPGCESRREILSRWMNVVNYIKSNYSDENIGISTHGVFMSTVYFHYFGKIDRLFGNCEYYVVDI